MLAKDRRSSYPYITGDGFRSFANYIYDEDVCNIDPSSLKDGDVIFVRAEYCAEFFQRFHPQLPCKYILITHNSDLDIPGSFSSFLEEEKLLIWFGQNVCSDHPKLRALPIGLTNRYNSFGEPEVLTQAIKKNKKPYKKRKNLAYFNVSINTCFSERSKAYEFFSKQLFCKTISCFIPFKNYLRHVLNSKFIISPRGAGVDCHRTWEALYLGAIPVVRRSGIDPLFSDLPVLILEEWEEVTQEFLLEKVEEFSKRTFDFSKLYIDFWLDEISYYKNR